MDRSLVVLQLGKVWKNIVLVS